MLLYKKITVSHPLTGEKLNVQEHVMIWLLKEGLWQKGIVALENGFDVHHKDFNHKNNDPSNLIKLSRAEHRKLHWEKDDAYRMKALEILKKGRESRDPQERLASIKKAKTMAVEKMLRDGPSPAQLEGLKKARAARIFRNGPLKELTSEEIAEIKRLYPKAKGKYNQAKALRERFGISRGRLSRIAGC
jgi:hypothetical protein